MDQLLTMMANIQFQIAAASALVSVALLLLLVGFSRERRYRKLQSRISTFVETQQSPLDAEMAMSFSDRILKPLFRSLLTYLGKLTPSQNRDKLRQDLLMAGNPGNLTTLDFVGLKLVAAVATSGFAVFYTKILLQMPTDKVILGLAGGAILGLYLPSYWLQKKIKQRSAAIMKSLPDALDMLTIVVDAGLGFDAALLKLGERWNNELTREFERVVSEMRMGIRRIDALHNLANRTDVAELRSFIAVLIQADRMGVSISNVLHAQSEQLRIRRRQWAEERAHKIPVLMLVPIMLFIFPALFAIILGPAVPGIINAFK